MSVLVYVEADNGKIKKSSLEAICFGAALGNVVALSTEDVAASELEALGNYGASKVLHAKHAKLSQKDVSATATAIAQAAQNENATLVVLSRSSLVDAVAPRIGVKMGATVVSNVVALPEVQGEDLIVKRGVFTGKAFATAKVKGAKKVVTIKKNAVPVVEKGGSANVEAFSPSFSDADMKVTLKEVKKQEGSILLPDAERVVSAGRGMKAAENWGIVEDLAKTLQAATACSKPVSDLDWRPHHEHVGQTGIKVSPDLYIAVGISGAIQHLAGVNSSKVIVVINKDAEAPFFKSADYGIVGDAFDILPKLNEALKAAL